MKFFFFKNFKSPNLQESSIKKSQIFLWFWKEMVILHRKTRFGAGANSAANLRSCANSAANLISMPKMQENKKRHLKQDCFLCKISRGFHKSILECNSTTGSGVIFLFFAHKSRFSVCQGSRMVTRSLRVRKVPGSSLCEVEIVMLHSWR